MTQVAGIFGNIFGLPLTRFKDTFDHTFDYAFDISRRRIWLHIWPTFNLPFDLPLTTPLTTHLTKDKGASNISFDTRQRGVAKVWQKRPLLPATVGKGVVKRWPLTRVKGCQRWSNVAFHAPLPTPLTNDKDDFSCSEGTRRSVPGSSLPRPELNSTRFQNS